MSKAFYPGRSVNEITRKSDIDRLAEFTVGMYQKWMKGRKEHGKVVKIDPLEEAMSECVDIANYAMDTYFRIKKMREALEEKAKELDEH